MKANASDTVTVHLSSETKAKLDELASYTRQSKSSLAGEAISDNVERELDVIAGIQRGLADMKAGRVTPHEAAMRRVKDTITRAQKGK